MKKIKNSAGFISISLLCSLLVGGNLYFFRFSMLDSVPKILFIPLCVIMGALSGFLFLITSQKIKAFLPGIKWGWILLLSVCLSIFIFAFNVLYYIPISPNAFSETTITIKAPDDGSFEEVVINDIRIDQRPLNWQSTCQLKGPFRWGRDQVITLENSVAGQGSLVCKYYPDESVEIIFPLGSYMSHMQISVDNQIVKPSETSTGRGDILTIDVSSTLKGLLPKGIIFLNIFFFISLLVVAWISFQSGKTSFYSDKNIIWVLSGFLICYFLFFILPTYFNNQQPGYFPKGVLSTIPFGDDFKFNIDKVQSIIFRRESLGGSYYSPASFLFFIPFALVGFDSAYRIFTFIKIAFFVLVTFIIPVVFIAKKDYSLPTFFLLTGLVCYGLEYELERGQSYSLVYALLFISIFLFQNYYAKRLVRYLAYILFSMTIQMKLSPVIFVVFFVRDWNNLKSNINRIILLGSFNLLLVFATGVGNAMDFFMSISRIGGSSSPYSGMENHSINSYVKWIQSTIFDDISGLSKLLVGFALACLGLLLIRFILDNRHQGDFKIDPIFFMGLSMAALLIPNENNDYTLAIIPLILSVGICMELALSNCRLNNLDLFILSLLYSITLFPNAAKPHLLFIQNNCLPILLMLVYLTISAWKEDLVFQLVKRYQS